MAFLQILSVSLPSSFSSRFVNYGARATSTSSEPKVKPTRQPHAFIRFLDYVSSFRVPHSYFTQFYVASVLSSITWATQLVTLGPAFWAVAIRVDERHVQKSMSLNQVMLCWALLMIQGSRRLYESLAFSKPSSSQMWFVHWLLGIVFYIAVGVAIWIEGTGSLASEKMALLHFRITNPPSLRTFLCLPLFLFASGLQHDCHQHLFSLKKYSLPTHPLFRRVVCPHYTAECVIYLSLALLAAPRGEFINKTLLCCAMFVAVNLGVTAATTKRWYMRKFGEEAVRGRWMMIPGVF